MSDERSKKQFLEDKRNDLRISKIALIGQDRVEEILNSSWDDLLEMSEKDLAGYIDTLSGYNLFLRAEIGRARASEVALKRKLNTELYSLSSRAEADSIDERRAIVLSENPQVAQLEDELTMNEMLINQIDSVIWGLESRIKRLEFLLQKKRFNDF